MYACKGGNKEIVELLLKYDADVKVTNNVGDSCVSMAQKGGPNSVEIVALLVSKGASLRPGSRQVGDNNMKRVSRFNKEEVKGKS